MIVVPRGWFLMGQDEGRGSHQPQRRVYLDAYAIDCTEVTHAAFGAFVAQTGHEAPGWHAQLAETRGDDPVTGVLWQDAEAYCRWMNQRLPTEAEWEKAARGTDGRRYPWGDRWGAGRANTAESGRGGVVPVGSYPQGASPYGVLDMAGNAAEWVADYFDWEYYRYAPERNPQGADSVLDHVVRGGSWASPPEYAQTFFRDSSHSARPNRRVGFRCAMSVAQ
ncbi:MAG: SUMF1/EgtB/PvdO family nonheme iron enzyme [Anaerolineae bacterium]|jgi:formylglycine-generating enzyme required for sulfatase activity